ncbi:MAG: acetylxylan esterase [Candidatus Brocadiia bacterium]
MDRKAFLLAILAAALAPPALAERLMLQVEDFQGPWRRQTNIKGYLGKGFCTSNANPKVAESAMRTTAKVTEGGTYVVWARGFTSANSRRAFQVEVAGRRLAVTHKDTRRRWVWERAGEVELKPGTVQIAVHDADVGYESADAILLTNEKGDDPMAEERNWRVYPDDLPERANALRFNIQACLELARQRKPPASKAQWEARREGIRTRLQEALGLRPWPPRTPLEARVTGRAETEGYRLENVVFQSRPRFYVTANVYLPRGGPERKPAVVVVPGHAMKEAKNYELYRRAQLGLVRQGFVVLSYDPIGQGERRRRGYAHLVGYPALMVGWTNEGVITWDTMRAIDYLAARPDVDPARIGLTGNSGGGENTFYAMPLEPRVAAGASFCFVCSYYAWVKDGGNHCICNHLPGILRHMEEFEIVGLCAPRPFLAGNGARDPIFPIAGTRRTMERARAIYAFYEAEERIAQRDVPLPHGWAQPLREAATGWMARWLLDAGDGSPIPEPDLALDALPPEALLCLKDGAMPADALTYVQLVRREAQRLAEAYPPVPAELAARRGWAAARRKRLWETFGGKPPAPRRKPRRVGTFAWRGRTVERLAVPTEPGLEVPALFVRPGAPAPAVLVLDDEGKAAARSSPAVVGLLERGLGVLLLDPRATGEGKVHANHCASDAVLLGRPLLAQQAADVLAAARYLRRRDDVEGSPIAVYGRGRVGLVAVAAAALGDETGPLVAEGAPASLLRAIEDPLSQPLWAYPANVLQVADVPQMLAMAAPRPALLVNPVGYRARPLAAREAEKLLAPALGPCGGAVRTETTDDPPSAVLDFLGEALGL